MKLFLLSILLSLAVTAYAQSAEPPLEVGVRYVATKANAPPGTCGCFFLQGAAADFAIPLASRLRVVVDLAGSTVDRVPQSPRGLSVITLLAGPRYVQRIGHLRLNVQALLGAARGFDSDFVVAPNARADTSTNLAFTLGGSLDLPLTRTLALRGAQVEYLQTNLPNGIDNRQRNLRFGAGLVLRLHLPQTSR